MKNFLKDRQPWSSGALSWVFSSLSMTNRMIIKIIIIHLLIIIKLIIFHIWSDHFKIFRPPVHCYSQCGICCSQDSVNMNLKFSHKSPRVGGMSIPKRICMNPTRNFLSKKEYWKEYQVVKVSRKWFSIPDGTLKGMSSHKKSPSKGFPNTDGNIWLIWSVMIHLDASSADWSPSLTCWQCQWWFKLYRLQQLLKFDNTITGCLKKVADRILRVMLRYP